MSIYSVLRLRTVLKFIASVEGFNSFDWVSGVNQSVDTSFESFNLWAFTTIESNMKLFLNICFVYTIKFNDPGLHSVLGYWRSCRLLWVHKEKLIWTVKNVPKNSSIKFIHVCTQTSFFVAILLISNISLLPTSSQFFFCKIFFFLS